MGFMKLEDFRDDINMALGIKAEASNERLDRWINQALAELTARFDFHRYKRCVYQDSTVDQNYLLLDGEAANILSVLSVKNLDTDRALLRLGLEQFHSYRKDIKGAPERWARRNTILYLWPVPNRVWTFQSFILVEPDPLTVDQETTLLPAQWDRAILLLATRNAMMAKGEIESATLYFQTARTYIGSLNTDNEYDSFAQSAPLDFAREEDDVVWRG